LIGLGVMQVFLDTSRGELHNPHSNVSVHGKLKDFHNFTDPVRVLSQNRHLA
jgi:hypothetical protein